jgi:hypothetical protein
VPPVQADALIERGKGTSSIPDTPPLANQIQRDFLKGHTGSLLVTGKPLLLNTEGIASPTSPIQVL